MTPVVYSPQIALARWLFLTSFMIIIMIVVGAITRLTESGLSIADWHAVSDMLPPMSAEAWQAKFDLYKTTPEYTQINKGMDLSAFKSIYFWEWLHRLLGRVIGLIYALPLLYFWVTKRIPKELKPRFVFFLFLGGLQGAIGWYMVKSGLIHEPRVSHFRLALHLGTALLLLSCLWAQALELWPRSRAVLDQFKFPVANSLRQHFRIGFVLLLATLVWGAFTAGLDAGLACSDFPKTCAQWLPSELFFQNKFWSNIVHEPTAVQYSHRVLGTLTFLTLFTLGLRLLRTRDKALKRPGIGLHVLILFQWMLGVGTVQSHVLIPLAAAHQFGAVMTLLFMVSIGLFMGRAPKPASA